MNVAFQPPSKSLTSRDYQFIALAVILFLIISTALVFANLTLKGGGGDFYVHWVASRGFLIDNIDPYGGEVPGRVQQLVYKESTKPNDEPYILVTPFQILPFYYPFSLLSDPQLARAIFTLFLELALLALAILCLRLTDWETPRIFTILFIFFAIFNFYTFQALYEASPVLILGFFFACILITYRAEMDELAGIILALSLYNMEVGAPFLFLVLLHAYTQKRNRVFAGFFMMCFVLFFISLLTYPGWIIPFLRAVVNNLRADFGFNILTIFVHIWPSHGLAASRIVIIVLFVLLGYEWSFARSGDFRRFYWAACLSLAVAPLLGFRTEMEHLAVLMIPLALIFSIVHDRWRRFGYILTLMLMFAIFSIPWLLYLFAVNRVGAIAQEIIFLFLPVSTFIGLYWVRWWAIHPSRVIMNLAIRP